MLPKKAVVVELSQELLAVTVTKTQCSAKSCSALHAPSLQENAFQAQKEKKLAQKKTRNERQNYAARGESDKLMVNPSFPSGLSQLRNKTRQHESLRHRHDSLS